MSVEPRARARTLTREHKAPTPREPTEMEKHVFGLAL
jgi:hypothetical protein